MKHELLSTREVATMCGVSTQTICYWVQQGMPVATVTQNLKRKSYKFDADKVQAWVKLTRENAKRKTLPRLYDMVETLENRVSALENKTMKGGL